jgi:hypothetical protein
VDAPRVFRLPATITSERERATAEVLAAVDLVASGAARRVTIQGLEQLEGVLGVGLARAQAHGIAFAVQRDGDGSVHIVVGPRTG